jgi:putative transposase
MNDTNSLAHTTWNCKYHVVFASKYRRKVFFGRKRKEIGVVLMLLCELKQVIVNVSKLNYGI